MTDIVQFSRLAITDDLWRNPSAARLYFYILRRADENGCWQASPRQIKCDLGLSRQQYRTALSTLRLAALITTSATASATTITLGTTANKRKPTTARSTASATTQVAASPAASSDGFTRFADYFNRSVADTGIPKITRLTDARKNALRSIFKEYGRQTVETVIAKVIASDFLARQWGKVSFDWIFKKANFLKILEGNYDNRTTDTAAADQYAARRGTDVGNHSESDYGGPF